MRRVMDNLMVWALVLAVAIPPWAVAQEGGGGAKTFKSEELEQMLAPIALYPDEMLVQILMASTYPLEVVQADRWAKQNKNLKGDALAKELEKQPWDPSVKSLVNFPDVLGMMSQKLDLTQKLGDAFLAQEKDVMDTVQKLRKKAEASGNLKSTKEQKVIVEKETQTIVIQPTNPEVVYVPTYNPTVVYGAWPYPAYPPAPYYPYAYAPGAAFVGFATGVAIGAAWGYAWGGANWHGGDVNIDTNRNVNRNTNIDRSKYNQQMSQRGQGQGGKGSWQHDASHRKGVSYRDQGTAQKFNRASSPGGAQSRQAYRGRTDAAQAGGRGGQAGAGLQQGRAGQTGGAGMQQSRGSQSAGRGDGAFSGMDRGGSSARASSSRGSSSRQSMSSGSRSGSFGGGGGAGRAGGGGAGRAGGGGRR